MTPYEKELLEALRVAVIGGLSAMPRDPDLGLSSLEDSLHYLAPVEITRDMVLEVKAAEECSYIQAKQALNAVNGDIDKARLRLRKMGLA